MGTHTPDDVLNLYTPACIQGDKARSSSKTCSNRGSSCHTDKRVKVDGVEFGDGFEVGLTTNGYLVTLPGSKNIRLHVNGDWVSAHDQLETLGLEQSDDGDSPDSSRSSTSTANCASRAAKRCFT